MTGTGRYFAGVACVLAYIAIASLQSVALNVWLASANVYLVAGLSFVVVTACYTLVGLSTVGVAAYQIVFSRRGVLLAVNVTSVFNWLFYFLAVKYLEPAVAVTLTQGIGPLSMTAYNLVRRKPVSRVTLACHGVILVAAALMCWYVVRGGLATGPHSRDELVMATVAIILAIGLVGVTTAAYFLQRGIELAPPLAVSTCLALSPVVVFGIGRAASGRRCQPDSVRPDRQHRRGLPDLDRLRGQPDPPGSCPPGHRRSATGRPSRLCRPVI